MSNFTYTFKGASQNASQQPPQPAAPMSAYAFQAAKAAGTLPQTPGRSQWRPSYNMTGPTGPQKKVLGGHKEHVGPKTEFTNISVGNIIIPKEENDRKPYVKFSATDGILFDGDVRRLHQQRHFKYLNFSAYLNSKTNVWRIIPGTLKMTPKPLTVQILALTVKEQYGYDYDESLQQVINHISNLLSPDSKVPPSDVLADPEHYARTNGIVEDTLISEKCLNDWDLHDVVLKHKYFISSGVTSVLDDWMGHILPFQTRDDIAQVCRILSTQPWMCFFHGNLPVSIEPIEAATVDDVELKLGASFPPKFKKCIEHYGMICRMQENRNSVTIPIDEILKLGVTESELEWLCGDAGALKEVWMPAADLLSQKKCVQNTRMYMAENLIASTIRRLVQIKSSTDAPTIRAIGRYLMDKMPLGLKEDQVIAIIKGLESPWGMITGAPGRGKTRTEIIECHLAACFLPRKPAFLSVSGKAKSDIIKGYKDLLPALEELTIDMVKCQGSNGDGLLRANVINELIAEEPGQPLKKKQKTTPAGEEEETMEDETPTLPPSSSSSLGGIRYKSSTNFLNTEEAKFINRWREPLRNSGCFLPPKEKFDMSNIPEDLRRWALAWNSPVTPTSLLDDLNARLLAERGCTLDQITGAPSVTQPLAQGGTVTSLFDRPKFPKWLANQLKIATSGGPAENVLNMDKIMDDEFGEEITWENMVEYVNENAAEDEEELPLAAAAGAAPSSSKKPKAKKRKNVPLKPLFEVANSADYVYQSRMCKDKRSINKFNGTDTLYMDEQLLSLPGTAGVVSATPFLKHWQLCGDKNQLGSMETGSLFPIGIQMHADTGFTKDNPELREILQGPYLRRLITNHRNKPKTVDANGVPEPTELSKTLDGILRREVPKASSDVEIVCPMDIPTEITNPVDGVGLDEIKYVQDAVLREIIKYARGHPDATFMSPYKEDVSLINRVLFETKFPDLVKDNPVHIPICEGLPVRLTGKSVHFGNQTYTNGFMATVTHIFKAGELIRGGKIDSSGFGGKPRTLIRTRVLTAADWSNAFIVLDNKYVLEMSRIDFGGIVPGFCCTVHSAQGREGNREVFCLLKHPHKLTDFVNWRMLYTALSRSKGFAAIIIALPWMIGEIVTRSTNDHIVSRLTGLLEFLKDTMYNFPDAYFDICERMKLKPNVSNIEVTITSKDPDLNPSSSSKPVRSQTSPSSSDDISSRSILVAKRTVVDFIMTADDSDEDDEDKGISTEPREKNVQAPDVKIIQTKPPVAVVVDDDEEEDEDLSLPPFYVPPTVAQVVSSPAVAAVVVSPQPFVLDLAPSRNPMMRLGKIGIKASSSVTVDPEDE